MFEQHIENWKNRLQEIVTLGASPYHGGVAASFLSEGPFLPDAYRRYFAAEVGWRLYETRAELEENPRFRLADSPEAQDFFGQFDETLRQAANFDAADVSAVIDSAVKTRLNFLCRPRTTLKWFIFRGEPTLLVREILLRLNYFYDYSYLTEAVISRIAGHHEGRSSSELLSVVEFERIVEEIDNDYILDLTPHQFVEILAPLFEFFSPDTPVNIEKAIPTEALIIFLDDKGVEPIAQELERSYYDNDCTEVTEMIFLEIVTRILDAIEEETTTSDDTDDSVDTPDELPDDTSDNEDSAADNSDAFSHIESEVQKSEGASPSDVEKATDTIQYTTPEEDEFLTAPGAVAAAIALKEFIRPKFAKRDQPAKFTMKFAPSTPDAPDVTAVEQTVPHSADELLTEADEQLEDVQESLDAIEESLEHLEEIAEEVGETLNKAVETLEEIEEEISEHNLGLADENRTTHSNIEESDEDVITDGESIPTSEEEAILQQIFEEMNALSDSDEVPEAVETDTDQHPELEQTTEIDSAEATDEDAGMSIDNESIAEIDSWDNSQLLFPSESEILPLTEENDSAHESSEHTDEPLFTEGNSDDVIALILEQDDSDFEVQLQNESSELATDIIENKEHNNALENASPVVAAETVGSQDNTDAKEIAETERAIAASYPSLSAIISDKQRDRFVKKLFGKEGARYDALVHEIDSCPSWKDAAQRFDQFLIVHNIAHDNSAAEEFRDAIKSRYSS